MLEPGERILGLEHATGRGRSISHLNDPTNFDVSQLYNRVKINETDFVPDKFGLPKSILKVENQHLTPIEIYIPDKGNELTAIRRIDSIDELLIAHEPDGDFNTTPFYQLSKAFIINEEGTRVCVQNMELEPVSITAEFDKIRSTPVWNGEPMNIIYVHACVDLLPSQYKSLDLGGENWGGGLFFNLYSDESASDYTQWTPLLCGTQISSRTIAVPLAYNQTKLRLMVRGCRSWSLEFLAYVTGL